MPNRAIVTAFDENYLMPGLLAATTGLQHSPTDSELFILGVDLSPSSVRLIQSRTPGDRTTVLDAADFASTFPEWSHISNAAWARIGIGSMIPDRIERAVYLDADSFTRDDLEPLFEIDLEGRCLAACLEVPIPTHRARHEWGITQDPAHSYLAGSRVPDVYGYFNTGVMVIDLQKWRESDIERRLVSIAANLPEAFFLLDQDAMNQELAEDWLPIEWETWNWPGYLKGFAAWDSHVVHYVDSPKPWVSQPLGSPFRNEYLEAAKYLDWEPEPTRERVRSGLIETFVPYSLVVRRKRIARSLRREITPSPTPAPEAEGGSEEGKTRGLVVAFDERYLMPGLLAAKTALDNSPPDVRVHVLGVGLSTSSVDHISKVLDPGRVDVVDATDFTTDLPPQMPPAAWARLGIAELLPQDLGRVAYVDADTLTRKTIAPLFDMNLDGRVLAACVEEPNPLHRGRHDWGKSQNPSHDFLADSPIPDNVAYFNSGVLAIDMDAWRDNSVGQRLMSVAEQGVPESYVLGDQDLLNEVLWRDWLPLDWSKWNWPGLRLDRLSWEAHIVHYKGPTKPWDQRPWGSPFGREYQKAAESIGWQIEPERYRLRPALIETFAPYSVVLRRRRIAKALGRS